MRSGVDQFSSQVFVQGISLLTSAKTVVATGEVIGLSMGLVGIVIGSVVDGIVIGLGANAM